MEVDLITASVTVERSVDADLVGNYEESPEVVVENAVGVVNEEDEAVNADGNATTDNAESTVEEVSTSFKLQVSGTEDEADEEEEGPDSEDPNSSVERRGNSSTPLIKQLSQSPFDYKEKATKRKHYEVRRSGSEECLLGFDELSGEAELVRDDNDELLDNSEYSEKTNFQGKVGRNSSPFAPAAKKLKQGASGMSPARASPKHQAVMKSPIVKLEDIAAKDHVVADDVNGTTVSPAASKSQPAKTASTPVAAKSRQSATAAGSAGKRTPTLPAQSEFYRKPFEYGWRRELVWRANIEASKDKADVYFISPNGKKLRTRNDIIPLLEGDLTIDHFNFAREPLGVGPELETVRSAKPSSRTSVAAATIAAAPATVTMGKRISKPKGPKGASPPPEGWTPTRALKVNNAALLSSTKGHHGLSSGSGSGGGGGGGGGGSSNAHHSTPVSGRGSSGHSSHSTTHGGGGSSRSRHNKSKRTPSGTASKQNVSSSKINNSTTNNNNTTATATTSTSAVVAATTAPTATATAAASAAAQQSAVASKSQGGRSHEPCSTGCVRAKGEVPQLQCSKCLRLYHQQCVRNNHAAKREYICEVCQPATLDTPAQPSSQPPAVAGPPTQTATTAVATGAAASAAPANKAVKASPNPSGSSHGKSAVVRGADGKKLTQTIAVVKGKKYVMVAKPNIINKRNAYANDIENDLKQINESIRNSRKPSTAPSDSQQAQSNAAAAAVATPTAVDQSNKLFAANFFANVSFAYDALLTVLKYLKIHERPRAASVCKLWNLAAKDTSLWHTVRMKNSKVYNWSGFAAALRRGETKHLDLRKMLVASTRGDETWQDFSEHIGTVCSLEVIDLCRCSARVVESLFQSNKNLLVLNAIAINDDTLNLEHIGNMQKLEELRLRTCEPCVLSGELQPLQMLRNVVHLSLTAIRCLGTKGIEVIADLTQLKSLELGECGDFDETFANAVLPKLKSLQRLRLENGQETSCCTLAILDAVAQLEQLQQLELVNFDIKPGFDERTSQCTNLRKLLIIPTYISQSATTNHIVLSAVQHVADTLRVFTWGVTVELLRVTALYVDQCEESSKKEKHHFDECIPVLKPVPGAPPGDDDEEDGDEHSGTQPQQQRNDDDPNSSGHSNSDVPQIEILPLDKVESILAENLPNTKYTIVKVPYHATCKQQLVE